MGRLAPRRAPVPRTAASAFAPSMTIEEGGKFMNAKLMLAVGGWMIPAACLLLALATPAAAQRLADDQTLRVAVAADDIRTVDPHFSIGTGEAPASQPVYDSLVKFPDGVIDAEHIEPSLATDWNVGGDKLTWTFRLRRGVQWHEGHGEFGGEDVKFSIERVQDEKVGSPFRKNIAIIESVTVVDKYTVQIKTREVFPALPSLLTDYQAGWIVSKHAVEAGVDLRTHPIGTGPFRFEAYKPRESFSLVRNDDYWRGKPTLERIVVMFMNDDSTRELAMRNGEVDAIMIPAKQEWVDRMRGAGFDVHLTAPANMFALLFNLTKKPLDDLRVRRALSHAIDRQELINFLGKDVARPEISPLPSGYVGHTDDVPRYPFDPDKARQLLAEAGHGNGLKLEMVISNSNIYLPPMQVVQEQWKRVGVQLELKVVDHPTYHRLIRQDVNPVIIYGAFRYPLTGNVYLTQFYHSDSIIGKPTASINFSHLGEAIPGVDQWIDAARFELDVNRQKELWQRAQRYIKEQAVSFPLFTRNYAMAKSKRMELGFEQKSNSFYTLNHKTRLLAP
jgi:peptide/nickel transport system substrate-binding protein